MIKIKIKKLANYLFINDQIHTSYIYIRHYLNYKLKLETTKIVSFCLLFFFLFALNQLGLFVFHKHFIFGGGVNKVFKNLRFIWFAK
jgi:hypothetical protein